MLSVDADDRTGIGIPGMLCSRERPSPRAESRAWFTFLLCIPFPVVPAGEFFPRAMDLCLACDRAFFQTRAPFSRWQ